MVNDIIFLDAIKEGFWYKDHGGIKRASPSIDMYILSYTCEEDAEHYGCKTGMSMKFVNPMRNQDLRFTLENYGELWSLNKSDIQTYTHTVIDDSLHNFAVGTDVFILQDTGTDTVCISDGKLVKMCHRTQLKLKEEK